MLSLCSRCVPSLASFTHVRQTLLLHLQRQASERRTDGHVPKEPSVIPLHAKSRGQEDNLCRLLSAKLSTAERQIGNSKEQVRQAQPYRVTVYELLGGWVNNSAGPMAFLKTEVPKCPSV